MGGGVGEASLGNTQERSWRGRAISATKSWLVELATDSQSSLSSSKMSSWSMTWTLSSATRGKSGANVERNRWLRRMEDRVCPSADEDFECEVSWLLGRLIRFESWVLTSVPDPHALLWFPIAAAQRGLPSRVRRRLWRKDWMKDRLFSSKVRSLRLCRRDSSLTLSLRPTNRTLFRWLSPSGMD